MKILINTPFISSPAGVSNHYLGLKPYFSKNVIYNQFITRNFIRRKVKVRFFHEPLRFLMVGYDFIKFILLILIYNQPSVLLNPSFGERALKRDRQFLKIAKFFGCKVAVFIHGWDKDYLKKVFNGEEYFDPIWRKADTFFVLAKEFKEYLEKLGIKSPIHLTTTKVSDKLLDGVPEEKNIEKIKNILFLARVDKAKGIFIAIDAYNLLKQKYPDLKLRVVGPGRTLDEAKLYTSDKGIADITFTGPLVGNDLINEFLKADIYILPTFGEGMPTSVLEAMAFGLPVITRPVGGLNDFFENDKMGYLIESLDPGDYACHIGKLITNPDKAKQMSKYNKQFARVHFMASKVARNLETILIGL